jgi:hypothetical protein
MQVKRQSISSAVNRRTCLVHAVEVVRPAVGGGVLVVAVHPHGGVESLHHHAPKRPRVRQVAPQHHVLHQHVPGLLPAFLANRGGDGRHGSRCVARGGGAHAGSRRRSADGDEPREEGGGGGRECGYYRGWQWKGKEGPHTCEAVALGFLLLMLVLQSCTTFFFSFVFWFWNICPFPI